MYQLYHIISKNSSRLTIFKQFVTFKQEKEVIFTVFFDLTELFDLTHTRARGFLKNARGLSDVLPKIGEFAEEISLRLGEGYTEIKKGVFAANDAKIAPTAYIEAPTVIGSKTEIRHSAFIRGCAIIGDGR